MLLFAGGQPERLIEARDLMTAPTESESERAANNLRAAELLEGLLEDLLQTEPVNDRQISDIRMAIAESYFNARSYSEMILVLTDVLTFHKDRFDEAEEKLTRFRGVRNRYNELSGLLVGELQKNPLDETQILEYITEMGTILPGQVTTGSLDILVWLKLVVDRSYSESIIELAHELILEGEYIAAIDRYLNIQDIDTGGVYETSFDIQKNEFLELELPDLFVNQIETLTSQVPDFNNEFTTESAQFEETVRTFSNAINTIFPDDPLNLAANIAASGIDAAAIREEIPQLNQLLSSFSDFVTTRADLESAASRIINLGRQFPSFLPADVEDRTSEYLGYLGQFIAGPRRFDREGIVGAALRQSRRLTEQLTGAVSGVMERYLSLGDVAYEEGVPDDFEAVQSAFLTSSEIQLTFFSFASEGEILDRVSLPDYIASLQEEDREAAFRIFLEREQIEGRSELLRFALRSDEIEGEEYSGSTDIFNAYNEILAFLGEVAEYSENFLGGINDIADGFPDLSADSYIARHNADMEDLTEKIQVIGVDYFNQYVSLVQGDTPQRFEIAKAAVEEADSLLAGREVLVQVGDITSGITRYFPSDARDLFIESRETLTEIINIFERLQTEIPPFTQSFPELRSLNNEFSRLIEDSQQILDEIEDRIPPTVERVAAAEISLEEARDYQTDYTNAIDQGDHEIASNIFTLVEDSYDDSLNIDYRDDVIRERESVITALSEELSGLLLDIVIKNKTEALERVVVFLADRDLPAARDALADAQSWDDQLPTPPDPIIIAFENEIGRSVLLLNQREVPAVSDSRYPQIANDLNEAAKALTRAQTASDRNDNRALEQEIEKSRSFISSVRDQLPANFEVSYVELQLVQLENPLGFDDYFQDQVEEVGSLIFGDNQGGFGSGEYSGYSIFEKNQLLARIEALNELRQDDQLEQTIISIEVDLGLRESPAIVAARNRAFTLLRQGEALLASARRESSPARYESLIDQSLVSLRQAQAVFPRIPQLAALISEAEILLGLEATVSLPFEANQLFEQGAALLANQNLVEAKRLLDTLWANTTYRSYFPLRELITELYALLGQNLPG